MNENKNEDVNIDKNIFANALQRLAKQRKLTQNDVARLSGKQKITIAQMYSGKRFTTTQTLLDLCDGLKVTPNDLLVGYLKNPDNIAPDRYAKIISDMEQLKHNEIKMLHTIVKGIIDSR